jgi:hypothetical protein
MEPFTDNNFCGLPVPIPTFWAEQNRVATQLMAASKFLSMVFSIYNQN